MNTHDKIELADEVLEQIIRESRNSDGTLEFARRIARAAIEADRKNTAELLKNPVHVHTNMCRGIIAPITFDQLAHVLGDEATKAWIADRKRRDISNATKAYNMQSTEPVKRKRPYAQGTALGEFGVIPMCDQVDDETVKSVNKTDWNAELASWSDEDFVQVFHECPDLANRLRKILAEPVKVPNMTTKSDTERERAEFEAWAQNSFEMYRHSAGEYSSNFTQTAWAAWQARAALQSQHLEDAERLEWLVENMYRVDIDEGHRGWFVLERDTTNYLVEDCKTFREAIDHARRIEGDNHE